MLKKKIQKTMLFAGSILFALSVSAGIGMATKNVDVAADTATHYIEKASVRIGNYQGVRFETVLSADTYNVAENSAVKKYGTYVIPSAYLDAEEVIDQNTTNEYVEIVESVPYENGNAYKYHSVLYDIPVWGYETELTARSFVAYGEDEENLTYEWTETFETSIAAVAAEHIVDAEANYTKEVMTELVEFLEKSYVYDYADEDFATIWQAIGESEVSVSGGTLNVTAGENDGVLIPFGSITTINGLTVSGSASAEVEVKANGVSLGAYTLSENTDLTSAFINAGVDSLYYLELVSPTAGTTINLESVTVKAVRDVNVLYNFDEYSDVETLATATGAEVQIVAESGLNSRNALQLGFTKGTEGSVSLILPAAKTGFQGYTGIRFYVNGNNSNARMEVRVGNGSTYNAAYFTLNKNNGNYMTIPFSAFDGETALDQINELSFYFFTGEETSNVTVADISIGTADCYGVDNRADFMNSAVGIIEDFNSYTAASEFTSKWTYTGGAYANIVSLATVNSNTNGMKLYVSKDFEISAKDYVMNYDYTGVNGFRMDIQTNFSGLASDVSYIVGVLTVTIGSEGNYYTMSKDFFRNDRNESTNIVCDFAGMTLADGSTGALNRIKIDTLKIGLAIKNTNVTAVDIRFDNLEFYADAIGAKNSVTPNKWTSGTWSSGTVVDADTGKITYTLTSAGTYNQNNLQLKDTSYSNHQDTYAVKFTLKTTNVKMISLRLLDDAGKGIKGTITPIADGEYEYILYYNQMEQHSGEYKNMRWYYYIFYITWKSSAAGTVEISDYQLLVG